MESCRKQRREIGMTINDIARLAGVSIATVSRVINNKGYVKEETRKRVEAVIDAQGYRPSAAARALTRSSSSMIAVIMSERPSSFSLKILEVIEDRAARQGDSVLLFGTGADVEREQRAIFQAIEHRVRGILFLPVMDSEEETARMLKEAEKEDVPVVLMDWDLYTEDFDRVLMDNKKVIYDGTALLLREGHRKIAFISCPEVAKEGGQRKDGYIQCMKDWDIPIDERYLYEGRFEEQSGYEACRKFFSQPEPPTAVLSSCSSVTLGCFRYLNEQRMVLGKDIGLVGFDDISLVESVGCPVTALEQPVREMGENVCDLLYMRINGAGQKEIRRKMILGTRTVRRGSEGMVKNVYLSRHS